MKPTQQQRVVSRLRTHGEISRNECLRNYISRLSAIIQDLEAEGWEFETKRRGGDYVYVVKEQPKRRVYEVVERNGERYAVSRMV